MTLNEEAWVKRIGELLQTLDIVVRELGKIQREISQEQIRRE